MIDSQPFISDAQLRRAYDVGYAEAPTSPFAHDAGIRAAAEFAIAAYLMPSESPYVLADMAALRADGPCVVFLRPKRELTATEESSVSQFCHDLSKRLFPVKLLHVPHDFEILAVGEADLERLGWTKLPTTAPTPEKA